MAEATAQEMHVELFVYAPGMTASLPRSLSASLRSGKRAAIFAGLAWSASAMLLGCGAAPPTHVATPSATPAVTPSAEPVATPSATPLATPSRTAPTHRTFESARHGYRLVYPGTWRATEYEGEWTALDEFDPGAELPGEDVIAPLTLLSFLVVNSMAIPDVTTEEEWLSGFEALVQAGMTDECPGAVAAGSVGGHEATVITSECDGDIITGRHLVHAGRGYYFTTRWSADDAAAAALLAEVMESIQFAD